MGFFKNLFGKKDQAIQLSNDELVAAGACPNCWGSQSYDDEYRAYTKDQTKANISGDKQHQKAFVAQFVETNVTGIKLKSDGDKMKCSKCNTRF